MNRPGRRRLAFLIAAILVGLAALPVSMRLSQAASWRVAERDRPLVERALGEAVAAFGTTPERYRRSTSPSVERRGPLTCVRLMSVLRDDGGSYAACYDGRTGERVSEWAAGRPLGGRRLSDRLHELLLGI
jgi:hypothetical protein